jgi:two-component system, chemotaxis family, response regulator Rcp1
MAEQTLRAVDILLVEDNPDDERLIQEILRGIAVPTTLHAVARGEAALAFLRHEGEYERAPRPDVIFLDLDLPGMDRCQILEEIANDSLLRGIPVVLFNGANDKKDHLVAAGGVAAYLTKSLDREQFMKLMEKLPRPT